MTPRTQPRTAAAAPAPLPPPPTRAALREAVEELGLDACGVAPVALELRREYYQKWIAEGQHGDMGWMANHLDRRLDPARIIQGARSIICVGLNYYQPPPDRRGRIATYALGRDYHTVLFKKLKRLCTWLREHGGENRPYVDTGPVLERPVAERAGLGWQAKSTMTVNRRHGTWLFLGEVITTLEFEPDEPARNHCGTCTRCIDVCPTAAITAPYQLDARRCISYLTIEHQGAIPDEFRGPIGDRLFGCDDCLEVCPWNRWAQVTREERFRARELPDLTEMLAWSRDDFDAAFAGTAIKRLGWARWLRNVAVVLGNVGTAEDLPTLRRAASHDEPLVAEHAAWAVGQVEARAAGACNTP